MSKGVAGKPGRPTTYTEALVQLICERIAEGESLRAICRDEKMPSKSTIMEWLVAHEGFRTKYACARELQADAVFDEMREIADTPLLGVKTTTKPDGKVETVQGDMIEHRRLQVETRKWMAERLAPKKYGSKVAVEASGPDGGPIPHSTTVDLSNATDEQLRAIAALRVKTA